MRVPRARRGERTDGFTLIETILTIGLIALVAVFVIPAVVQRAGVVEAAQPTAVAGGAQTAR
jgi:prepilin-type N-terminal cleavage/methylation domain-containing protein